jgi:DNA polymerase elongation subunit (family B)
MMHDIASSKGFTVVAADTESLFLHCGSDSDRTPQELISEYEENIGLGVERFLAFVQAAIIKKKHYSGVITNGEIKVVGNGRQKE